MKSHTQDSEKGSVAGAILLVSGCCIGAGMLGLPVTSALAGFFPTLIVFFLSWLFMISTGLLLLEVSLWFDREVNIVTMAHETLGTMGKWTVSFVFLFLFYSLMVAYVAGSGDLFTDFYSETFGGNIPHWIGGITVILLFGVLIFLGTSAVDHFNRFLMAGLIATFALLVFLGIPHIKPEYYAYANWKASLFTIPAMIVSFGYHNLVPSLTSYLNKNSQRLKLTIIIGSLIPLIAYLIWELVILGLVPVDEFETALKRGDLATQALRHAVGRAWVVNMTEYFAFFAITTSFLAVALSFVDFLADGFQVEKKPLNKILLCVLALGPPFVFSLVYPKFFLTALKYAGGVGAVILFAIIPTWMVWNGRYRLNYGRERIFPGGKWMLILMGLIAVGIVLLQFVR